MTPLAPARLGDPGLLVATGFGIGLVPFAPGTVASMAAVLLWWPLSTLPLWWQAALILACILVGVAASGSATARLGIHDHPSIVIDEVAGQWIALFAAPPAWPALLIGFLLFRIFDIAKPWPIRWLERHPGGAFSIMADDVVAGLAALTLLQALLMWQPWLATVGG